MSRPVSIVDSHVHFWNPQRLNYPWLAGLSALNRDYLPDEYSVATQNCGLNKLIFVECGCEPTQSHAEVKWISELAAREVRIKGIVAHVSLERGIAARGELAALARIPLVKGVRRNLQGEADLFFCLQPDFLAGVRALADFNFSFDLCVVHRQLPAVIELVRCCPEIKFILDHCGKPAIHERQLDPWRQQICELAALPNIACKISGLLTEADCANWKPADLKPYIQHILDSFSFDRVLFGGDWPVLNLAGDYSRWLGVLDFCLAGTSERDLKKLFQTNAEKFYRI